MIDPGPTTLITPPPITPADTVGVSPVPLVLGASVLILLCWVLLHNHARRGLPPDERAFRQLGRRMGLTRSQSARVRRYAQTTKIAAPVGVLMNQQLLSEALGADK